eukprot:gnl/MRDRNA2_/MRDRNA2_100768_c0_seq1.p1 gnl/MRDRNA2_/MRDRNA2_100768_c0~~gnl/MRDRNA2_/MRDRNA2_100768_c0_seq1.p1  ORF type:complete len:839 (+),score=160.79 gnl/MRDRNA2_/MRDRNA2_100768_c0_seq1:338-2518(+)
MTGATTELLKGLDEGANPNASRDMYSLTTLHYAVQQGSATMVAALLAKGANALALDSKGRLPLYRAVLNLRPEIIELLLDAMEGAPLDCCKNAQDALGEMSAACLEVVPGMVPLPDTLIRRVIQWAAKRTAKKTLWHFWAETGRSKAFLHAWQLGLAEVIGSVADADDCNNTPLDYALNSNTQVIVQHLLNSGTNVTCMMPHFIEDCTSGIRALLERSHGISNLTSVELVKGENEAAREKAARLAAKKGDLKSVQAYYLAGVKLSQPGPLTRLTTVHLAAESGRIEVVDFLTKAGATLLKGLKAPDSATRTKVAQCLGTLKSEIIKAYLPDLSDLVSLLQDNEQGVKQAAAVTLVKIGAAKSEVMAYAATLATAASTGKESQRRRDAINRLGQLGEEIAGQYAEIVAQQVERYSKGRSKYELQNFSWEIDVRKACMYALGEFGEAGNSQVNCIIERFDDPDGDTARSAVAAIVKLKNASACISVLQDGSNGAKCKALEALSKMGKLAEEHVDTVAQCLKSGDKNVRRYACMALGLLGAAAHNHKEAIVERIEEGHTKITAVEALARLGVAEEKVKDVCAKEMGKLKQENPKNNSANNIFKMGGAAISDHAADLMMNLVPNSKVEFHEVTRQHVLKALGQLGEKASSEVVAEVANCLQDHHAFVRRDAAKALMKFGPAALPQAGAIALALKSEDKNLQKLAAQALKALGPPDEYAGELEAWEDAQDD